MPLLQRLQPIAQASQATEFCFELTPDASAALDFVADDWSSRHWMLLAPRHGPLLAATPTTARKSAGVTIGIP